MTKMKRIDGASWPHKIKQSEYDLIEIFNSYEEGCMQNFGRMCPLEPHILSKNIYNIATDSSVINVVGDYIGNDINIWSSAFFVKKQNSSKYVGFHQDLPYWQLSSNNVVTAWIAFSRSDRNNGCLEFIEYSSNKEYPIDVPNAYDAYKEGSKTSEADDLISFKQQLPEEALKRKRHYVELDPGEFSIHTIDVIHGSKRNYSESIRVGLAVRYVDANTHHLVDKSDTVMHVTGNVSKYMKDDPVPTGEFDEKSIHYYKTAMEKASAFGNKTY